MASSTIKKTADTTAYTNALSSGTATAQIISGSALRIGKIVVVSARIKILNDVTIGMQLPLIMCPYAPKRIYTSVPSIVNIENSQYVYHGLVQILRVDSTYYAYQTLASNIAANSELDMSFVYEAAEE